MKISVIIPYYNPDNSQALQKLLIRAVRSALGNLKGVCDHEVIIVNDGSEYDPDLSDIPDPAIRYLRRPHGMLGAARNTGIDNAKGNIIAFLDADDCYYPGSLAPCIEAMDHQNADLLGFGQTTTKTQKDIECRSTSRPEFSNPVSGDDFMQCHNLPGSACRYLIRMSLIKENGLRFTENAYIEDEEFTPRLVFLSRRYVNTDYPVYAYYVHPGSIITSNTLQKTEQKANHTVNALDSLISFRNSHINEPHKGLDRKINTLAIDHLRRTLRRKDWRTALPIQTATLQQMELFPLNVQGLPFKFRIFAWLASSHPGQYILHLIERLYR